MICTIHDIECVLASLWMVMVTNDCSRCSSCPRDFLGRVLKKVHMAGSALTLIAFVLVCPVSHAMDLAFASANRGLVDHTPSETI